VSEDLSEVDEPEMEATGVDAMKLFYPRGIDVT